jgi:3-phenylpropionate/trans-cinnamate dioxygenase ferredoxin subunit
MSMSRERLGVPKFVRVASAVEIQPGEKRIADIDGMLVVVVNVNGQFYAFEDICTHDGGPLGEGDLADSTIVCPRHGSRFDVRTGAALTLPAFEPVPIFQVRVIEGDVYVEAL